MSETVYTVHDTGQGVLKIIDGIKGVQVGVLSPRGKVVTPPIVSGSTVSFVVELTNGERLGTVHNLPGGSLVNQFRAQIDFYNHNVIIVVTMNGVELIDKPITTKDYHIYDITDLPKVFLGFRVKNKLDESRLSIKNIYKPKLVAHFTSQKLNPIFFYVIELSYKCKFN